MTTWTWRVVVIMGALLVASPAAAAPVTLNYTGEWRFLDSRAQALDFWEGMNMAHVRQDSPLTWTVVLGQDRTILSTVFQVGDSTLRTAAPTAVSLTSTAWVAPLGPAVDRYHPEYLEMSRTESLVLGVPSRQDLLFVGSNPGTHLGMARYLGFAQIAQVPEARQLAMLGAGLLAGAWIWRTRRRATRRE